MSELDYEMLKTQQDEKLEYEDLLRSKIKINTENFKENEEISFSLIFNNNDEDNPFY